MDQAIAASVGSEFEKDVSPFNAADPINEFRNDLSCPPVGVLVTVRNGNADDPVQPDNDVRGLF
jgi:hypothetical protein